MMASDVCFSKHVDDCAASDDWLATLQLLSLLMMMMFIRSIANQVDDVLQVATSF